ncbi:MAG TPA: hypothetical protein VL382_05370 [Terriglobales bacterium]|nr:hypothetical protein [Terriglobales bacterium]
MAEQVAVASQTAGEGSVSKLAQFFPEAVAVRIPVRVQGTGQRAQELSEQTLIEYGTRDEVLFASTLPLEFEDELEVANADGSLRATVAVVAVQYHNGHIAVAARFTAKPGNWIIQ